MDREERIRKIEVMSTDDTGNSFFEDVADYIEAEIEKAKRDAYADALYQYRHNKLIDYMDYLENKSEV